MRFNTLESYSKTIQLLSKNKLYIVGAGKYGVILGKYFNKHRIPWEGYVDRRAELEQVNGKPVYTYEEISNGYYIISSLLYKKEMEEELKRHQIEMNRIIGYDNQKIILDIYDEVVDWKKYANKLRRFHNKNKGERCFIIGNGPSLEIRDLEKIGDNISFASNTIYALYPYTQWRPTYYCACDAIFCREMMTDKRNMQMLMGGCQAVFTPIYYAGIRHKDDMELKQLFYIRRLDEQIQDDFPSFSSDCSAQVYAAGTVTYVMLQLAVYMGFEEIYLLGMDFNYTLEMHSDNTIKKNNVCNHMKIIEEEEKRFCDAQIKRYGVSYIAHIDSQLAGYQKAKQYTDAHGIKIYNATRGGKLEVFPRVDFDSLFD